MVAQEQGKLFMAYADLEVAKKRAPTDKHIELAMEQLEMDMGVPGMCYTRKEILRGAPVVVEVPIVDRSGRVTGETGWDD